MEFPFTISNRDVLGILLVMVRVAAFVVASPIFNHQAVPTRVRVLVAICLTITMVPTTDEYAMEGFGIYDLAAKIASETLIGVSLGFLVSLVVSSLAVAGELISSAAGLQIAALFDPTLQIHASPIAILQNITIVLLALTLDVHHLMIRALAFSFQTIPSGSGSGGRSIGIYLTELLGHLIETAFLMAFPIIILVLIMNLAMAFLARVAPQMNIFFSIGASVNELIVLIMLLLLLPSIFSVATDALQSLQDYFLTLITVLSP